MEKWLKEKGFKEKWLDDRSGSWFVKKFKFKKLNFKIYVEVDRKLISLETEVFESQLISDKRKVYEVLERHKLSKRTINNLLKRFK